MVRLSVLAACGDESASGKIMEMLDFCAVDAVRSGKEALEKCRTEAYDIVIADAVLPGVDGFALAGMIRACGIEKLPGIVVTAYPGMAREVHLTGVTLITRPFTADELLDSIEKVLPDARRPSDESVARINAILDKLGVPCHPGRDYLAEATFLAHEDMTLLRSLTGKLYPGVGKRFGVNSAAVERAMRHVIDAAWAKGSIESQYEIFKNTIDAARGKPTCGGMIAQLAYMLRREVF